MVAMVNLPISTILRRVLDAIGYVHGYTLRRFLPARRGIKLAGVDTGLTVKMGDTFFRNYFPGRQSQVEYESALVSGLHACLRKSDRCVVIGAGWGITSVIAARLVGQAGAVWAYEGSSREMRIAKQVVKHAGVDNLFLINQIVDSNISVYNSKWEKQVGGAPVPVSELPNHDVLEMDCEGSELSILKNLVHLPRNILVETHGFLGAPTIEVHALLEELGYFVENLGVAESHLEATCVKNDIMVLLGTLSESST